MQTVPLKFSHVFCALLINGFSHIFAPKCYRGWNPEGSSWSLEGLSWSLEGFSWSIEGLSWSLEGFPFRVRILKGIPSCHEAYLHNNGAWER
jgi:hypothetical protein